MLGHSLSVRNFFQYQSRKIQIRNISYWWDNQVVVSFSGVSPLRTIGSFFIPEVTFDLVWNLTLSSKCQFQIAFSCNPCSAACLSILALKLLHCVQSAKSVKVDKFYHACMQPVLWCQNVCKNALI